MKLLTITLGLTLIHGCVVAAGDGPGPNLPPEVVGPIAQCWWSGAQGHLWAFDTFVEDPDGPYDVVEVYADVYDARDGDRYLQSFPLQRTADGARWYSDWYGSTTVLDCTYAGYVVDVVAYDAAGSFDLFTVVPARSP